MRIDSISAVKSVDAGEIFKAGKNGELDYSEILRSKADELREKLENGETEEKIQTGGQAFTIREWDKLMTTIDKAQDKIKEEIEHHEEEIRDGKVVKTTTNIF